MSFRNRLALFLVVTLIAVQALTVFFAYTYLRHDLVERGKRELAASMGVFTRQLTFLSDRVTDGVNVLSLDYALRAAIGQHDRDTELSALRNHGNRIGATRMMLVGLDGGISADTTAPQRSGDAFPFASLLQAAAENNEGTALATLGGQIYWIVVVPVRAPVPIAFIAACIPVNDALLEKLREISSTKRSVVLASLGPDGRWIVGAKSAASARHFHLPTAAHLTQSEASLANERGSEYLTVTAPLKTAAGSAPVVAIMDYPLDEALAAYRSLIAPMLFVLIFGLLAALAGAMLIVRSVSRPLEVLASAAKRIAGGDYSPPPRLEQRDELGHLADALANMTQSIAEREAALKSAMEAMEMARNQAVQANDAKSQFLANMSHEFRTPLNAIVGFSEMMEQQVLGPIGTARYAEYAHDIHTSGQHLRGLVDRMLDLAEAESQRLTIARVPVSPGHMLRECVSALELFARQSGVRVHLREDAMPLVEGDEAKLRQAFVNLIHNAIKFTPAGGEVEISAAARNNRLAIRIADNGIGMEPELLPTVVRPFHRLRHAFDGQHQGAGIGLPFAKVVIELHGGSLLLSSAVGVGTTVLIELPVAAGALTNAA
ncbi:MAG TPA: ATP-binding protein [Rhizomicrobium sp.]|nr:ATP-binding protein [Rhizomicrobium sp.]